MGSAALMLSTVLSMLRHGGETALGGAGTLAQAAMRNPLAEPGVPGITAGTALAALLVMVALPGVPTVWLPWAAFGGAMAMAALIQILAWGASGFARHASS